MNAILAEKLGQEIMIFTENSIINNREQLFLLNLGWFWTSHALSVCIFFFFHFSVQKTANTGNISLCLLFSSHTLLSVSVSLISSRVPSCSSSALCVTMCLCFSKCVCMCLKIQEERRGAQGVFPLAPKDPLTFDLTFLSPDLPAL